MKCKICNKPLKENTDGNNKYCQGHDIVIVKPKCPHCKRDVIKSDTKGYDYQCLFCDEDFYRFECN